MLKRTRNADGRMPLRAHLVELRNRLLIAFAAIIVGAVFGWFLYEDVLNELTRPLSDYAAETGREVALNFNTITSPFDLRVKMSLWIGVILASPMWIYQLWAFITPGLTRKERWYAVGFLLVSVPLFLSGIYLAYLFLPNAVRFFVSLTPADVLNLADITLYLAFVTRIMLAFGIAFLLPVVMVALNFVTLVSGRAMIKSWRVAVVLCFTFAAVASPTPDFQVMFALALPMFALYLAAAGISLGNDWRRGRRDGTLAEVAVGVEEPLPSPEPLDDQR